MITYEFPLTLQGEGETVQEAWLDACIAFSNDPGNPPSKPKIIEDLCSECGEERRHYMLNSANHSDKTYKEVFGCADCDNG